MAPQALSGTLIGVVDQPNGNSLIQIYDRHEERNIVRHFLLCFQEGFYGVLGALERALGDSGLGLMGPGMAWRLHGDPCLALVSFHNSMEVFSQHSRYLALAR